MHRVLVLNGPNLDVLGQRRSELYGTQTLAEIETRLRERALQWPDVQLEFYQANGEGELIDWLHRHMGSAEALIVNAGGLTHTSVSLRDAIEALAVPTVEVHLSNIHGREEFRQRSLLAPLCLGSICGLGGFGYEAALEALARRAELPRRT